ncbi:alpha/beta hydrolase [Pseudonocardia hispaniensis]|uniref:Alpha/beta hydrolase n=1 Tax=Pseudonocardia hispaniensis TaxID=904933 RepID=A0ABW1J4V3_9PSEU
MPSRESDALRAQFQEMSDILAANPQMDLGTLRNLFETLHLRAAEPAGVTYEEVDAGGVAALWCRPEGAVTDGALLYTHGGGFACNSMHSHRKLAGHLARAAGMPALVIDYRLAPEHPFPAQLADAVTAYRWLLDQGVPAGRIATAGDSAGGNLATAVVLKLREEGVALPGAIVGLSPWYDMEHKGKTLESNAATDALVQLPILQGMSAMFLGEQGSPTDPLANPLHADVTGLPPIYLTAGGHETLLDDTERFADKARAAGVVVTVRIEPGQQHVYPFMAGRAPEADAAIADIGAWLRVALEAG